MEDLKKHWGKYFHVTSEEEIRVFASSIGDENPLHHDCGAARAAGLRSIIAPGVMVVGFVSSAIADQIPGVMVGRLEMEFLSPVYAESQLFVGCTVLNHRNRIAKVDVKVMNGSNLLARGSCMLLLPKTEDKQAALQS